MKSKNCLNSRAKLGVTAVTEEHSAWRWGGRSGKGTDRVSSSRLFFHLTHLSNAMEPNSPKKIQFAVPLFQSQIDPEAAEQIRKRRPTPASLVIMNEHVPPEKDEKRTNISQAEKLLGSLGAPSGSSCGARPGAATTRKLSPCPSLTASLCVLSLPSPRVPLPSKGSRASSPRLPSKGCKILNLIPSKMME
ncbi:protein phosphatase 1 regulatory subunit 1C isoform 3-T3 [Morphnus guianensis]